jgi:hypothetical protein
MQCRRQNSRLGRVDKNYIKWIGRAYAFHRLAEDAASCQLPLALPHYTGGGYSSYISLNCNDIKRSCTCLWKIAFRF